MYMSTDATCIYLSSTVSLVHFFGANISCPGHWNRSRRRASSTKITGRSLHRSADCFNSSKPPAKPTRVPTASTCFKSSWYTLALWGHHGHLESQDCSINYRNALYFLGTQVPGHHLGHPPPASNSDFARLHGQWHPKHGPCQFVQLRPMWDDVYNPFTKMLAVANQSSNVVNRYM